MQVVRHAVADSQVRLPGHACGAPPTHDDAPSHEPWGVNVLPLQAAAPQVVPSDLTLQAPPPEQVPSRPQALALSTAHSLSGS